MECFEYEPEEKAPLAGLKADAKHMAKEPNTERGSVSNHSLKPSMAFETFAGKMYMGSLQNGTEISSSPFTTGRSEFSYDALPISKRHLESPLDRFNRLKAEVDAFAQEMKQLKAEEAQRGPASEVEGLQDMSSQISGDLLLMKKQLTALEESHGNILKGSGNGSTHPSDDRFKELLMTQLRLLQQKGTDQEGTKKKPDDG